LLAAVVLAGIYKNGFSTARNTWQRTLTVLKSAANCSERRIPYFDKIESSSHPSSSSS
jgi:hypothetical protein